MEAGSSKSCRKFKIGISFSRLSIRSMHIPVLNQFLFSYFTRYFVLLHNLEIATVKSNSTVMDTIFWNFATF